MGGRPGVPAPGEFARLSTDERHDVLSAVVSRRGVLRAGGLVGAAGLLAGPLLLASRVSAATSAGVPVLGRWLAFGADPARQVVVRWQLLRPVSGARIWLGTDPSYGRTVAADVRTLRTVLPSGEVFEQHYAGAALDGLDPATGYHYRVVHDGGAGGVGDRDARFRTAPERGQAERFTFTAFGDQDVSAAAGRVERVLAREAPAFHLLAGDISYADETGRGLATDDYRPTRWDDYLAQIDPVASPVPWMVAAGNHDIEAVYDRHGYGGVLARFAVPGGGPAGCPMTWSMVHGRVAVVALDANEVTTEFTANLGYSGGGQTRWAEQRLAAARADPDVDFVVVVLHQCAYSTSSAHGSDAGVRSAWTPLFDRHGVDLVISGHNHVYERTDPIRAGSPTGPAPTGATVHPATDGTTYVVAGGGGAALTGFRSADRTGSATSQVQAELASTIVQAPGVYDRETVGWSRVRHTGWCALAVDVDPGPGGGTATMTVRALGAAGELLDTVTLARPARSLLAAYGRDAAALGAGVLAVGAAAGGAVLLSRHRGVDQGRTLPAGRP